jgi:hypothetical protein
MNTNAQVVLLSVITEPEAGYWRMNGSAQIVVSSNRWTDAWWITNNSGAIIPRNLP